ncbi:MAG: LON peptidase substrate-binding domain-containing protein, partial [Pseudomonadota bacterium]
LDHANHPMIRPQRVVEHRMIGMVQPFVDSGQPPKLHKIGCAGRVTSLSETEDGRYLIALTGISRFRIKNELDGFTPFRRIRADWDDFNADLSGPETAPGFEREEFMDLLKRYFTSAQLSSDFEAIQEADEELLVNSLSMMCPFSVEERQALLEAPRLSDRFETLMALMRFAIASGGGSDKVQ